MNLTNMEQNALIDMSDVHVFFDGTMTEPQLNHPERVVLDSDGNVWCGGEQGEIFRIDRSGSQLERVASTGGFVLANLGRWHITLVHHATRGWEA